MHDPIARARVLTRWRFDFYFPTYPVWGIQAMYPRTPLTHA